jgi:agmatine deiminase
MKSHPVFISDLLVDRAPVVVRALRRSLAGRLRIIPNTKDIWCRDYMPVEVPGHPFVQFRYDPDYLHDSPELRTSNGADLLNIGPCVRSDLIVDGGNVVRFGTAVILTEKVYRDNPDHTRAEIRAKLTKLLKVDRLLIIPAEPRDVLGHADGVLAFIDDRTLLVNDYRRVDPAYGRCLTSVLARHGFELIPFPYCPTDRVTDGIPSAEGVYVNFLETTDNIFLPTYGRREDEQAVRRLERAIPGRGVVPIRCNELAVEGGVLHCVTWNDMEAE